MKTLAVEIKRLYPRCSLLRLEQTLQALPGISSAAIDPATNTLRIEHDDADVRELLRMLDVLGYDGRFLAPVA